MRITERYFRVTAVMAFLPLLVLDLEVHAQMVYETVFNGQLDNAWQIQVEPRPEWMDRNSIEQLSYAMGVLMYSTVKDVNLSVSHIASGMESQRRVNRKLGESYMSVSQAQAVVTDYEKHLKASADRFIEKWQETHDIDEEKLYFREFHDDPCTSDASKTVTNSGNLYQYFRSDGWENRYPKELDTPAGLQAVFCNDASDNAVPWRAGEFEANANLIEGLEHLMDIEDKQLLERWMKKWGLSQSSPPELTSGKVYDFTIPAVHAYGDNGMKDVVLPHAVLRMLVRRKSVTE